MTKRYKNRRRYEGQDMEDETMDDRYTYIYTDRPRRLRRNKIDGMLGGVCAGIGDYLGMDPLLVRIIFILLVISTGLPFFIYFILWLFIPSDKRAPYYREYREAHHARRKNPGQPLRTASFRDVKSKFRSLEARLQDLERNVTSKEWKLRRDFRDLEN